MSRQLKKYFKDIADKLRDNGLTVGGEGIIPTFASWNSVTYGDGKFVAVPASGDKAIYSADGVNWTEIDMPISAEWCAVTYGNGRFVALPAVSGSAYSSDGINWTFVATPDSGNWSSVVYGKSKFVAINKYGKVACSTNGESWTEITTVSGNYTDIAYGDNKFIIVSPNGNKIAYSVDGEEWITKYVGGGFNCIAYGNNKFVAVKYNTTVMGYSEDGIDWNFSAMLSPVFWIDITYGGGKFVAVASNSDKIACSIDGINWTESVFSSIMHWRSIVYGNDRFVAITYDNEKSAFSRDGITWDDKFKADEFPKKILELAKICKDGATPAPSDNDLVMHFNGTISDATGNTAFTEAPAYISVTSDKSKFGNGSLRCYSTSGSQITGLRTTKKYNVGTKDFTIDFWFYYDNPPKYSTHPGYYTVIEFFGDNKDDGCAIYETHNSCKAIIGDISSLGYDYTSPAESGLPAGQWNHIALVRKNGVARLYFNGQQYHNNNSTQYGGYSSTHWPQDGNLPFSDDLGEVGIEISQQMASTVKPNFYIDELRVKIGEAVWTSDFTPPTAPYN